MPPPITKNTTLQDSPQNNQYGGSLPQSSTQTNEGEHVSNHHQQQKKAKTDQQSLGLFHKSPKRGQNDFSLVGPEVVHKAHLENMKEENMELDDSIPSLITESKTVKPESDFGIYLDSELIEIKFEDIQDQDSNSLNDSADILNSYDLYQKANEGESITDIEIFEPTKTDLTNTLAHKLNEAKIDKPSKVTALEATNQALRKEAVKQSISTTFKENSLSFLTKCSPNESDNFYGFTMPELAESSKQMKKTTKHFDRYFAPFMCQNNSGSVYICMYCNCTTNGPYYKTKNKKLHHQTTIQVVKCLHCGFISFEDELVCHAEYVKKNQIDYQKGLSCVTNRKNNILSKLVEVRKPAPLLCKNTKAYSIINEHDTAIGTKGHSLLPLSLKTTSFLSTNKITDEVLLSHMKRVCYICKCVVDTCKDLAVHAQSVHNLSKYDNPHSIINQYLTDLRKCTICDYIAGNRLQLTYHCLVAHSYQKPTDIALLYKNLGEISQNLKVRTCNMCGFISKNVDSLSAHVSLCVDNLAELLSNDSNKSASKEVIIVKVEPDDALSHLKLNESPSAGIRITEKPNNIKLRDNSIMHSAAFRITKKVNQIKLKENLATQFSSTKTFVIPKEIKLKEIPTTQSATTITKKPDQTKLKGSPSNSSALNFDNKPTIIQIPKKRNQNKLENIPAIQSIAPTTNIQTKFKASPATRITEEPNQFESNKCTKITKKPHESVNQKQFPASQSTPTITAKKPNQTKSITVPARPSATTTKNNQIKLNNSPVIKGTNQSRKNEVKEIYTPQSDANIKSEKPNQPNSLAINLKAIPSFKSTNKIVQSSCSKSNDVIIIEEHEPNTTANKFQVMGRTQSSKSEHAANKCLGTPPSKLQQDDTLNQICQKKTLLASKFCKSDATNKFDITPKEKPHSASGNVLKVLAKFPLEDLQVPVVTEEDTGESSSLILRLNELAKNVSNATEKRSTDKIQSLEQSIQMFLTPQVEQSSTPIDKSAWKHSNKSKPTPLTSENKILNVSKNCSEPKIYLVIPKDCSKNAKSFASIKNSIAPNIALRMENTKNNLKDQSTTQIMQSTILKENSAEQTTSILKSPYGYNLISLASTSKNNSLECTDTYRYLKNQSTSQVKQTTTVAKSPKSYNLTSLASTNKIDLLECTDTSRYLKDQSRSQVMHSTILKEKSADQTTPVLKSPKSYISTSLASNIKTDSLKCTDACLETNISLKKLEKTAYSQNSKSSTYSYELSSATTESKLPVIHRCEFCKNFKSASLYTVMVHKRQCSPSKMLENVTGKASYTKSDKDIVQSREPQNKGATSKLNLKQFYTEKDLRSENSIKDLSHSKRLPLNSVRQEITPLVTDCSPLLIKDLELYEMNSKTIPKNDLMSTHSNTVLQKDLTTLQTDCDRLQINYLEFKETSQATGIQEKHKETDLLTINDLDINTKYLGFSNVKIKDLRVEVTPLQLDTVTPTENKFKPQEVSTEFSNQPKYKESQLNYISEENEDIDVDNISTGSLDIETIENILGVSRASYVPKLQKVPENNSVPKSVQKKRRLSNHLEGRKRRRLIPPKDEIVKPSDKLTCDLCAYSATTRNSLKIHFEDTHFYESKNKNEMDSSTDHNLRKPNKNNTRLVQKTKKVLCEFCGFPCASKKNLIKHHRRHRNDLKSNNNFISCKLCGYIASSLKCLKTHQKNHGKIKITAKVNDVDYNVGVNQPFFDFLSREIQLRTCKICGWVSETEQGIAQHQVIIHDNKNEQVAESKHECNSCSFFASSEYWLGIHKKMVHSMIYFCDQCSFKSKDSNMMYVHKETKHFKRKTRTNKEKGDSGIEKPNDIHININQLMVYQNTNYGIQIENDNVKDLKIKSSFSCNICSFKTIDLVTFDDHIFGHKNGLHPCDECPFMTRTEWNLNRHKNELHKIKHKEKESIVDATKKNNPISLKKTHEYKCSLCAYESSFPYNFKRHVNTQHKKGGNNRKKKRCAIRHGKRRVNVEKSKDNNELDDSDLEKLLDEYLENEERPMEKDSKQSPQVKIKSEPEDAKQEITQVQVKEEPEDWEEVSSKKVPELDDLDLEELLDDIDIDNAANSSKPTKRKRIKPKLLNLQRYGLHNSKKLKNSSCANIKVKLKCPYCNYKTVFRYALENHFDTCHLN